MSPAADAAARLDHPAPRLRYEPALDGVRAFAVLAVIGYHANLYWIRGGFLGVDVFFVLSGYLITALLLAEHGDAGRIGVRAFYARRARRLLPALLLLLLGVAAYSGMLAFAGDRGAIRTDALASLLYVQNWHLVWSGASYFTAFAAPSPLRHLWSLAIEEQFYLVWPLALIGLLRVARSSRRALGAVIAAAALASALLMAALYHSGGDPSRVYYGTDTRAQELLVGALLAVLLSRSPRVPAAIARALPVVGLVGAGSLVVLVTRTADTSGWLYRGGFLAVATATSAVVAAVTAAPAGGLARGLSVAPLRATGRISYGLYLWHWPVMLWLTPDRTGWHGGALLVLRVAVTFAIAAGSFVVVEQPVRAGATPMWRGRRLTTAAVIAVVAVVLAFSISVPASAPAFDAAGLGLPGPPLPPLPGPTTPATTPQQRALHVGGIFAPALDRHDGRPHIVMVGDSVLFSLAANFDPGPTSRADYYSYPQIGCSFLRGIVGDRGGVIKATPVCPSVRSRWQLLVDRRLPDISFLYAGALEVLDHTIAGRHYRVGTPAYADRLRAALLDEVDLFASRGGLVALPTVPCYDPPDFGVAGTLGGPSDRADPRRVAAVNQVIREVARARSKVVRIIDVAGFLCPHGHPRDHINGVLMREDGVHFTPTGARIMSRWLAPRLEALVPAGPVFATKPAA